ncbi:MAG: hypothetical protein HY813_02420 [Candidatus Portnoybacteria bacterium]|nr:hypothetical protein [Candidatus Portnoybacteria bacterium]
MTKNSEDSVPEKKGKMSPTSRRGASFKNMAQFEQFHREQLGSTPERIKQTKSAFLEKWDLKEYTLEELDEIREELNNIWHSRSKTVDTEDLLVSHLPDEALMVYDEVDGFMDAAATDKNWHEWLNKYLAARNEENPDKQKEVLSGIVTGGVKNWAEILNLYKDAENLLKDYRGEIHTDLINKHGEAYRQKELSPVELSREELVAMLENKLLVDMTPLIRCKTRAKKEQESRQSNRLEG